MKNIILLLTMFIFVTANVFAGSPESVEGATTLSPSNAKELYDQGVTFVDVRGKGAYKKGHIAKAHNIKNFSADALSALVGKTDPVVIYCSGVKCGLAGRASKAAVDWGWTNVSYFREGYPGWKDAGYPVE